MFLSKYGVIRSSSNLSSNRKWKFLTYFRCAACSKCFLTSNKLKYHIRRTHLPASGSLQCTNCDKECKSLRLLLTHQQCHIRISCPHCRKIVSAANYDHHVRTTHASHVPKKRKAIEKKSINKRPKDANKAIASGSQMTQSMELTSERNIRVQVKHSWIFQSVSQAKLISMYPTALYMDVFLLVLFVLC